MENLKLINNAPVNGVTGYIGNFSITGENVVNGFINADISVRDYLLSVSSEAKMTSALKMVQLNINIEIIIKSLSFGEKKRLQLAYLLCKKEPYIILDYFDKGLTEKEKSYFKRLFKKINSYGISILIHTNDLNFLINNVDKYCLVKNAVIYKILDKKSYYNNELFDYLDKPMILEFTNYCQKNGIKIEDYTDIKDLIKAIFRMVG